MAIFVAIAILAVSSLAAGWASWASWQGYPSSLRVGQVMQLAFSWSGVLPSILVLMALGLIWWQVDGWVERLNELDTGEGTDDGPPLAHFEEAVGHVTRCEALTSWSVATAIVTLLATIGVLVGEVLIQGTPHTSTSWMVIRSLGELLASIVILGVGLIAVVKLRRSCTSALQVPAEARRNEAEPNPN